MAYTPTDYIADQLRAQNARTDWIISGIDRARELAGLFTSIGIVDLQNLILSKRVRQEYSAKKGLIAFDEFIFTNANGKVIPYFGTENDAFVIRANGVEFAWSAEGHGFVRYLVVPMPGGFGIAPEWGSSSDAAEFREYAMFAASIALSFVLPNAGINLGSKLGAAIVGEATAAAYPAFASSVGNVALSTAMNGGNIESAVKGAALGAVAGPAGALTGSAVAGTTGIDLLGKVAASATAALVQGGDVKNAVAMSLLKNGAKSMDDFFNTSAGVTNYGFGTSIESAFTDWTVAPPVLDYGFGDSVGTIFSSFDASPTLFPVAPAAAPIPKSSDFSLNNVVNSVSNAAMAALTVVRAYKSMNNPAINQTARLVTADGSVIVASNDGYIKTQHTNGSVSVAKPTAGVPQSTLDGSIVVNNGDGTYTRISPTGARQTLPYAATTGTGSGTTLGNLNIAGLSISPTMLAIAAIGAGVLLMNKRR